MENVTQEQIESGQVDKKTLHPYIQNARITTCKKISGYCFLCKNSININDKYLSLRTIIVRNTFNQYVKYCIKCLLLPESEFTNKLKPAFISSKHWKGKNTCQR